MEPSSNDEFYIGWEDKAPPSYGSRARRTALGLLALAAVLGAMLALVQSTISTSMFEWGNLKSFSGTLVARPYPHLLVLRPGRHAASLEASTYYLVAPFKHGLDPALAASLDGKDVTLKGTLIYRGTQTMIEVADGTLSSSAITTNQLSQPTPVNLGKQTLVGEIVDSKCFLGVMNPGQLAPHRACAVRCISGGIPPILLVRQSNGPPLYFLLVSDKGEPVNQQVLDLVAEPVSITGEVVRQGDLLILRANPSSYQRVTH